MTLWAKKEDLQPILERLTAMEKRIGGIEAIQTELLRRVTPPPQTKPAEYRFIKQETSSKIG